MILIRTKVVKPNRKRYEPEVPFWKGLSELEKKAYIAKLDELDRGALKRDSDYRFS